MLTIIAARPPSVTPKLYQPTGLLTNVGRKGSKVYPISSAGTLCTRDFERQSPISLRPHQVSKNTTDTAAILRHRIPSKLITKQTKSIAWTKTHWANSVSCRRSSSLLRIGGNQEMKQQNSSMHPARKCRIAASIEFNVTSNCKRRVANQAGVANGAKRRAGNGFNSANVLLIAFFAALPWASDAAAQTQPNIVFILTDDHRHDCLSSSGNPIAKTPNLDRIASKGTRFSNAFVTLAICSPSRAACLTGEYGSSNGVTAIGNVRLSNPDRTFANALRDAGYATGVTGKWHLKTKPGEAGFEFASVCWSNGTWYDRQFNINGQKRRMPGFVDDVTADESIRFMNQAVADRVPFVLWMNTQVPHMDNRLSWPAQDRFLSKYSAAEMTLPTSWNDDLIGKPDYLRTARNRTRALEYGYDDPGNIREHSRDYYASVEQMDQAVGRVLDELDRLGVQDNTWVLFLGDNGWFLGEHGMTSKVLPYEESMRVPMMISGPGTATQVIDELVLNIDLTATIYELAGLDVPETVHGRSLLPLAAGKSPEDWRTSFLYEAPTPQLGSKPLWAVRSKGWKYVRTETSESKAGIVFEELYDLRADAAELHNLARDKEQTQRVSRLRSDLKKHLTNVLVSTQSEKREADRPIPAVPPEPPRTDLFISGVYP
ncbi:MAG: sulfatase-like hydrolase/transferase, partial [Planctomycetota bacterium]